MDMFDSQTSRVALRILPLKRAILIALGLFLSIGLVSAHRAYFQVRSLELDAEPVLRRGSTIQTMVVSSGRTYVDVRIELVQGARRETLLEQQLTRNRFAFFDPRTQRASLTVTLTRELLSRFDTGAAQVRATAKGRRQWTRVPPPTVREMRVEIERE